MVSHLEEAIQRHLFLEWLIYNNLYIEWIDNVVAENTEQGYYKSFIHEGHNIAPSQLCKECFAWRRYRLNHAKYPSWLSVNTGWQNFLAKHRPLIKHLCTKSQIPS